MLRKNKVFRILFLAGVFIASFHLSGIEAAFCDDGATQTNTASTHGCSVCQPDHHFASVEESKPPSSITPASFFTIENPLFFSQEFDLSFFRPPISLR